MIDTVDVVLAVLLIAGNAFFVAAEFALISARRDRLEALVARGRRRAVTVLRAGERLPLMLAGFQLGVTICSILLGRIGESAVARLLGPPLRLIGLSDALLHTIAFALALAVVVSLHVLFGEMVPKNMTLANPEQAAMLLIPPYLVYVAVARPFIFFYNWCTRLLLLALRIQPRDELEVSVSTVELSEMIGESVSAGLLDVDEYIRLTRALQTRSRKVGDIAVPLADIHAVSVAPGAPGPTVATVERALAATGYSRLPVVDAHGAFLGYLHINDILPISADPGAVLDLAAIHPLPRISATLTLPDALNRLRRTNSHMALTTLDDRITGLVALDDLVGDVLGVVPGAATHG